MIDAASEPSPEAQNQDTYDDLLTAIETSDDRLSLLIAVCDDPRQRQEIMQQYETELSASHRAYRVSMARPDPSLKLALQELMATESALQPGEPAVITVLGIEQLSFLGWHAEKSQQDVFFGYLQWTREALREFRFPIVIWVTYQILNRLSRQSPDFWGWRKGVFRFVSRTRSAIPAAEFSAISDLEIDSKITDETLLPLADLEVLIQQTAAQNPKSPLLASLYNQLGQVYRNRLNQGESADYPAEQAKAIQYFQKAIQLLEELEQPLDLATSLNNLALLYRSQGRYSEAEPLYLQALDVTRRQLGEEHPDTATRLNNLASLYDSQGRYSEAEPLYLQALDVTRRLLGEEHPSTATKLNNLASLYRSQGRYSEAEPLYLEALSIWMQKLGEDHPNTQTGWENFRYLLRQAVEAGRAAELSDHPRTREILNQLEQDRKSLFSRLGSFLRNLWHF